MQPRMSLPSKFEAERPRLIGMAQRMLGSAAEAEDVLQEAWIRFQRSDAGTIESVGAWLTTIVSRLAIDRLRARANGREDAVDTEVLAQQADPSGSIDPEQELMLADSVGIALLVVLDRLRPQERIAFVLHDLFSLGFHDIAAILGCSEDAARQLASRARRSVRHPVEGEAAPRDTRKKALVNAFFAASRAGDFSALLRVLAADVVLTVDPFPVTTRGPSIVRGAEVVAKRARLGAARQPAACVMLVDGEPGIVVAPAGRPRLVMTFQFDESRITGMEVISDPQRLAAFTLAIIDA